MKLPPNNAMLHIHAAGSKKCDRHHSLCSEAIDDVIQQCRRTEAHAVNERREPIGADGLAEAVVKIVTEITIDAVERSHERAAGDRQRFDAFDLQCLQR